MAWGLGHIQKTWFGFTLNDPELQIEPQPGILWWIFWCVPSINSSIVVLLFTYLNMALSLSFPHIRYR